MILNSEAVKKGFIGLCVCALCQVWPAVGIADEGGINGVQVGAGVLVTPKYEGSDEYDVFGVPIIAPTGASDSGVVQFRGPDDLRLRLFQVHGIEAGPLVGWRFDRDEDDADHLQGLGDVDGGIVAGAYAGYRFGAFMPFVAYYHQVTGDDTGGVLRFGTEAQKDFSGVKLTAVAGASYANEEYADSYFSVTAAQSVASQLPVFDAGAGIKDVYFGLSAGVPMGERWSVKLSGRYTRLLEDVADSPIVEDENQLMGMVGLTYRFDIPR